MPDGGTIDDEYRVMEKLKRLKASKKHLSKISIDDGYVEYSYDFDIGGTHSIHTLLGMICGVLGVNTPPKGEIRDRNAYTHKEIELAFFNHDTDESELSCEDYELKRKEWKSFKENLHKTKQSNITPKQQEEK